MIKINFENQLIIMRTLLAIGLVLLFPLYSEAQIQVTLEWQPVIDSNPVSYRVYTRHEGETYDYNAPSWEGTETSCAIEVYDNELIHYFVVRAVSMEEVKSLPSKEVCYGCTLCPEDPYKIYAGVCGCGVLDTDIDVDGIWDCYDPDDDNDGIEDIIEDNGLNQGDSNLDNILDSQQLNVGSITINEETIYIAIEALGLNSIRDFKTVSNPYPEKVPQNIDFAFGLFEYNIRNIEMDERVIITITLPEGTTPDTYYTYGLTPKNQTDHWDEFINDSETGVDINGNIITLYLVDALRGDNILKKDNMIIGLGGPGFILTDTNNNSNSDPELNSGNEEIINSAAGCFLKFLSQ